MFSGLVGLILIGLIAFWLWTLLITKGVHKKVDEKMAEFNDKLNYEKNEDVEGEDK